MEWTSEKSDTARIGDKVSSGVKKKKKTKDERRTEVGLVTLEERTWATSWPVVVVWWGFTAVAVMMLSYTHRDTEYRCLSNGSLQQLVNTDYIQNTAEIREIWCGANAGWDSYCQLGMKGEQKCLDVVKHIWHCQKIFLAGCSFLVFFEARW